MENQVYLGIDVSSATLDICVRQGQSQQSYVIGNQVKDIKKFLNGFGKQCLVICMENTGRYNWFLYEVLSVMEHQVYVVAPLHLKKSMGLVRGKNDKIDAERIAVFAEKNHGELKPWKPCSAAVQKLKVLFAERNYRIRNRRQLLNQQHDYAKMKKLALDKCLQKMNTALINEFDKQIAAIEGEMEKVIQSDEMLKQQAHMVKSIPGVGKVLCWIMLAKTEGFTVIDDPRKMACYSGVVPFDYQSGTSIRGRKRVSAYADKAVKSILHLAAMRAVRMDNDLRQYYLRKVAEGKNKMSVLNAVRNKIIHRIFAVVRKQQPYQCTDLVLS